MPIYMQYDDNSIVGDVTDSKYTKWIELHSFQFGIGRGITSATGKGVDREASAPSVSEIVVTKTEDSASANLFRASLAVGAVGKGKLVHIALVKAGEGGTTDTYLQFDLENTLISGYSMSSGGDRPSESLSLNFTKVTMTVTPTDDTTGAGSPDRPFYDLAQQKGG